MELLTADSSSQRKSYFCSWANHVFYNSDQLSEDLYTAVMVCIIIIFRVVAFLPSLGIFFQQNSEMNFHLCILNANGLNIRACHYFLHNALSSKKLFPPF